MTRRAAPVEPPVVLTVAGSDSGGGAGIQADLKTIEAGGAFGTSAVTSVTAQHTHGVESTHLLPVEEITAQLDAVLDDFDVAAVKTGMLATSEVVETVTDYAPALPNLVVDPVMVAASGDRLLDRDAEAAYDDLIAEAAVVTPNADEAAVLTGVEVTDADAARDAGERLVETGADAALVKGGHVPGDEVADVLVTPEAARTFRHDRVETESTHGSGCALSSAIATRLAHGDDRRTAVGEGIALLSAAVRYSLDVGEGPGAVHHLVEARDRAAREPTAEAVERAVTGILDRDADWLFPDGGTNVVGVTPYAETPDDVAGVEGGIDRTTDEFRQNRGVRFGAVDRLARLVLAVRERHPAVRFAVELRREEPVVGALADLPGEPVTLRAGERAGESLESTVADAPDDPDEALEGLYEALGDLDEPPAAVVGTGERSGRVAVLAPDGDRLVERVAAIAAAVDA